MKLSFESYRQSWDHLMSVRSLILARNFKETFKLFVLLIGGNSFWSSEVRIGCPVNLFFSMTFFFLSYLLRFSVWETGAETVVSQYFLLILVVLVRVIRVSKWMISFFLEVLRALSPYLFISVNELTKYPKYYTDSNILQTHF